MDVTEEITTLEPSPDINELSRKAEIELRKLIFYTMKGRNVFERSEGEWLTK